jgi:alpha-amylase
MKKFITLILLICPLFAAFSSEVLDMPSKSIDEWWSTGTFYEVLIRSYKDSDGDRFGDFQGILDKMDYIEDLGVSAVWFLPITKKYEQPNGYDVVDYKAVEPDYGTMEQFEQIIAEMHKRDIKVIFDLVINHTSSQHPFFQDALKGRNAKYRDWYIWDDNPADKTNWNETKNGWYYSFFYDKMPDLNYRNPKVRDWMKSVIRFWLDKGIDGFRVDAVSALVENFPGGVKNQPESYDFYREIRAMVDKEYPDREIFLVAEAEAPYKSYLGNGSDMFNSAFNFYFNKTIIRTIKKGKSKTRQGKDMITSIAEACARDTVESPGAFYGTLLSNHDLYAGLRPYHQLGGNMEQTKLAGAILLTLPGIPFVYYGEELGMDTFSQSKWDRWLRNCMQWDDSKHAGFTTAKKPWNIVNDNYTTYNAASMDGDPDSILTLYRSIISIRSTNRALSLGSYQQLDIIGKPAEELSAFLRVHEDNIILVVHNFSSRKKNVKINVDNTILNGQALTTSILFGSKVKAKASGGKISVSGINGYGTALIKITK